MNALNWIKGKIFAEKQVAKANTVIVSLITDQHFEDSDEEIKEELVEVPVVESDSDDDTFVVIRSNDDETYSEEEDDDFIIMRSNNDQTYSEKLDFHDEEEEIRIEKEEELAKIEEMKQMVLEFRNASMEDDDD